MQDVDVELEAFKGFFKRPEAAFEILTSLGFAPMLTDFGYAVDLRAFGRKYGLVHVVSIESLMSYLHTQNSAGQRARGLGQLSAELFEPSYYDDVDNYLYLVGSEEAVAAVDHGARHQIEFHTGYALKRIVTLSQLQSCLTNPFPALDGAGSSAQLELVSGEPEFTGTYRPTEPCTRSFDRWSGRAAVDVDKLLSEDQGPRRMLIEEVFLSVAGLEYTVKWGSDDIELGRIGSPFGVPLDGVSAGERTMFNLAVFLADAAFDSDLAGSPAFKIGLLDVTGALDSIRLVRLLDVLRLFSIATGRGLVLQSAPSTPRVLMKQRFARVFPERNIRGE